MKRIITIVLATLMLIGTVFAISGCESKRERLEREAAEAKQRVSIEKAKLEDLKMQKAMVEAQLDAYEGR